MYDMMKLISFIRLSGVSFVLCDVLCGSCATFAHTQKVASIYGDNLSVLGDSHYTRRSHPRLYYVELYISGCVGNLILVKRICLNINRLLTSNPFHVFNVFIIKSQKR